MYTHNWGGGVGGPNQNAVSGLCAGTYTLEVADDNGCTASTLFDITQPAAVIISSFTATDASCNGTCDGTIEIIGVNTVDYSSDNGASFQASPLFTNLCAGVYTIIARDVNGCTVSTTATINEPSVVIQDPIADITICSGFSGVLQVGASGRTPPYNFVWDTGDTAQFYTVSAVNPTSFTCTVYDLNGCVPATQTANVATIPNFIPVTSGDVNVCPGSPATITASATLGLPDYLFIWFYENDTLVDSPTLTFIPSAPTQVMFVAEDACPSQDTIFINVGFHPTPQPAISVNPSSGCAPLTVEFTNTTPASQVGVDCS